MYVYCLRNGVAIGLGRGDGLEAAFAWCNVLQALSTLGVVGVDFVVIRFTLTSVAYSFSVSNATLCRSTFGKLNCCGVVVRRLVSRGGSLSHQCLRSFPGFSRFYRDDRVLHLFSLMLCVFS